MAEAPEIEALADAIGSVALAHDPAAHDPVAAHTVTIVEQQAAGAGAGAAVSKPYFDTEGFVVLDKLVGKDFVAALNRHLEEVFRGKFDTGTGPDKQPKIGGGKLSSPSKRTLQVRAADPSHPTRAVCPTRQSRRACVSARGRS